MDNKLTLATCFYLFLFDKIEQQMRLYELVIVIKTSVSEAGRKKLLDTVKSWIKDVAVIKEDAWGQKVLSYPIKRESSGFYVVLSLESADAIPADLDKRLVGNESILRHLIVRKK